MMTSPFSYQGTELDALNDARNYYRAIVDEFAQYVGERAVEVGAGIGTFAEHLLSATQVSDLVLVEPADNNFPILERRFADNPRVQVVHGYIDDLRVASADSVVAVNVLEHINDDLAFLRTAYDVLVPGGTLLLFVPALGCLYGTLDAAFDHFRRYTKKSLRSATDEAGFLPVRLRYANLPGVATWFVAGKVFRRTTLRPRDVRLYDRCVVPWVTRIERTWEPPLGQSLVGVFRK
jgi:SAM-dependent methyltransferase